MSFRSSFCFWWFLLVVLVVFCVFDVRLFCCFAVLLVFSLFLFAGKREFSAYVLDCGMLWVVKFLVLGPSGPPPPF